MDTAFSLIAIFLPRSDFAPNFFRLIDAAVQALPMEDAQFGLRHVQPAPVLRGRVNFQPIQQPSRLGGWERLVQAGTVVRIQVVHHQADLLDRGIVDVHQLLDAFGPIARVRRSVTRTCRQPRSGSHIMNRLHVPLRSYS